MLFLIEDEEILKAYNKKWNQVSNLIIKEFDSQPMFNKKYLKTIQK